MGGIVYNRHRTKEVQRRVIDPVSLGVNFSFSFSCRLFKGLRCLWKRKTSRTNN